MSRKDYVKFAEMLRIKHNNAINALEHELKLPQANCMVETLIDRAAKLAMLAAHVDEIRDMAQEIADVFKSDNGAFDRERFLDAAFPNGSHKQPSASYWLAECTSLLETA